MIPTMMAKDVPFVTIDEMIEVDRAMIDDYHIDLTRMMENAGRELAHLTRERFLDGDPRGRRVVVLAGSGGNGGGALVAARRLRNYGADVALFITKPGDGFAGVPGEQLDIVRRMGVAVGAGEAPALAGQPEVVLDGVIGYSLKGAPRGGAEALIRWANEQSAPVVSLDIPSGVDGTAGRVFEPAIRAAATMTLALPKEGLRTPETVANVGELYLADIGVPPELYSRFLNIDVGPIFATSDVVRLVKEV